MRKNIVAEPQLAGQGKQKIECVKRNMPILKLIEDNFRKHQYFRGLRVLVHFSTKIQLINIQTAQHPRSF